jgi:hypothetical protein
MFASLGASGLIASLIVDAANDARRFARRGRSVVIHPVSCCDQDYRGRADREALAAGAPVFGATIEYHHRYDSESPNVPCSAR